MVSKTFLKKREWLRTTSLLSIILLSREVPPLLYAAASPIEENLSSFRRVSSLRSDLPAYSRESDTPPPYEGMSQVIFPVFTRESAEFDEALRQFKSGNPEVQEEGRSWLQQVLRDEKNPDQVRSAFSLFESEREEDKVLSRSHLQAFFKQDSHPYSYEAACFLFERGTKEDQNLVRKLLQKIVQQIAHPYCYRSASLLFSHGNEKDIPRGASVLEEISRKKGTYQFEAAERLFKAEDPSLQRRGEEGLKFIAQYALYERESLDKRYKAARLLFQKDAQKNGEIWQPVLEEASKSEDYPCRYEAALLLVESGHKSGHSMGLLALEKIAERGGEQQLSAAERLWELGDEEEKLVAGRVLVNTDGHQKRVFAAEHLFNSGEEEDQMVGGRILVTIKNHISQFEAAQKLFISSDLKDQEIGRKGIRFIAQSYDHLDKEEATNFLFQRGREEDKEIAIKIQEAQKEFESGILLLESKLVEDQQRGREIFRGIAQQEYHLKQYDSLRVLFEEGDKDDKNLSLKRLRRIIHQEGHPYKFKAAVYLFESPSMKAYFISRSVLHEIAEEMEYENYVEAAEMLLKKGRSLNIYDPSYYHKFSIIEQEADQDYQDQAVGRAMLEKIFQNETHPYYEDVLDILFSSNIPEVIKKLVQLKGHPKQYEAAKVLLQYPNEEDKKISLSSLQEIAQDRTHPRHYEAADTLSCNGDKSFFIAIAQDRAHPRQYDAAKALSSKGDKSFFIAIAQDRDHPKQYEAAQTLSSMGDKSFFIAIAQDRTHPRQYEAAKALFQMCDS